MRSGSGLFVLPAKTETDFLKGNENKIDNKGMGAENDGKKDVVSENSSEKSKQKSVDNKSDKDIAEKDLKVENMSESNATIQNEVDEDSAAILTEKEKKKLEKAKRKEEKRRRKEEKRARKERSRERNEKTHDQSNNLNQPSMEGDHKKTRVKFDLSEAKVDTGELDLHHQTEEDLIKQPEITTNFFDEPGQSGVINQWNIAEEVFNPVNKETKPSHSEYHVSDIEEDGYFDKEHVSFAYLFNLQLVILLQLNPGSNHCVRLIQVLRNLN